MGCRLQWRGEELNLADVTAVWYRRPGRPRAGADLLDPTHRDYCERAGAHFLEGVWQSLDCRWLPAPPDVVHFAENKLTQLRCAGRLGFEVPPTLVTNDPAALLKFHEEQQVALVSKSLRDTQPKRDDELALMYTNPVRRRDFFKYQAVRHAPEIFQRYVSKRSEMRVTVVGQRVLAAEIGSQESRATRYDWRHYDDDSVPYRAYRLPPGVEAQCVDLLAALNLSFGAIDLVRTPDDEFVFLEINPNGQWAWIEEAAGLPIAETIARWLAKTGSDRPPARRLRGEPRAR